jgi:hypothetical protein
MAGKRSGRDVDCHQTVTWSEFRFSGPGLSRGARRPLTDYAPFSYCRLCVQMNLSILHRPLSALMRIGMFCKISELRAALRLNGLVTQTSVVDPRVRAS